MSASFRAVVTFLLVILAVLSWSAAGVPTGYDHAYLADIERAFAVFLFLLAVLSNVLTIRDGESRCERRAVHAAHTDGRVPTAKGRIKRR